MSKQAQAPQNRQRTRDFVYSLSAPFSFLAIFAYLRLGGSSSEADAPSLREDREFYRKHKWSAAPAQSA